jgi:hypothetical protein
VNAPQPITARALQDHPVPRPALPLPRRPGNPERFEEGDEERGVQAFYLADDGYLIKVRRREFSLGFPTVRAEVTFP